MKEYCLVPRGLAEKMSSQNKPPGAGFISPQSTVGNDRSLIGSGNIHKESENIQKLLKKIINKEKLTVKNKIKRKREGKMIKKRVKRKSMKKISEYRMLEKPTVTVRVNPSIDHLIHGRFSLSNSKSALALLKFFENKPHIEWNEFGELKRPISGLNLIELIRKLMNDNTKIDDEDFEYYKLFLNAADVPFSFIKNEAAKKQLMMNVTKTRKGKGWVSYI